MGRSGSGLPAHHHRLHALLPACRRLWKAACGPAVSREGRPAAGKGQQPLRTVRTWAACMFCLHVLLSSFIFRLLPLSFCSSSFAFHIPKKVEENRSSLFFFLLFLRFFPMTPNWFLNITCPVLNIPMPIFFFSVLIGEPTHTPWPHTMHPHTHTHSSISCLCFPLCSGLIPYNFICVRTGSILSEISSLDDIFSWGTLAQLLAIALMALVPGALIKRYSKTHLKVDGMDNNGHSQGQKSR